MIYEPNTTKWKTGDIVIHDADAKTARMLMRITGGTARGTYFTRYLDKSVDAARYENSLEVLHDPARFGIERPNCNVTGAEPEGGASGGRRS